MSGFLHGVEIVQLTNGVRPIQTVRSSVIGLVGTAPDADATAFPLNTPVLIAGSRTEAAKLDMVGTGLGTLPDAIDGIFDQAGAMVVVVRVDEAVDQAETLSNVIGGEDPTTQARLGVQALLDAESIVGVQPKILIAPGFTGYVTRNGTDPSIIEGVPVTTAMVTIAEKVRGVVIADGPNTIDQEAIAYRTLLGSERVYVVDPAVKIWDTVANAQAVAPASDRIAGLMAKSDSERGFWTSPSNQEINGIVGTARAIDFTLGDPNARANLLNENEVATIIQKDGYRLWGNRTCSADPMWAFLSHVRTNDMILESLLRAHMWAVDRNITKTYIEDVTEGVNAYLAKLTAEGAISGGKCWANPELNTETTMDAGQVYFDFDYGRYGVAERITFRASVNNDYTVEAVFA